MGWVSYSAVVVAAIAAHFYYHDLWVSLSSSPLRPITIVLPSGTNGDISILEYFLQFRHVKEVVLADTALSTIASRYVIIMNTESLLLLHQVDIDILVEVWVNETSGLKGYQIPCTGYTKDGRFELFDVPCLKLIGFGNSLLSDIRHSLSSQDDVQSWTISSNYSLTEVWPDELVTHSLRKRLFSPLISVIIPFYNIPGHRLSWLCDTLTSLRMQTFLDFDVILVNDASDSPDAMRFLQALGKWLDARRGIWSGGIELSEYGSDFRCIHDFATLSKYGISIQHSVSTSTSHPDPSIGLRVINHKENQGLSGARSSGVLATRAPYVFFLDPDDLLYPTALETLAYSAIGQLRGDTNFTSGVLKAFAYPSTLHYYAKKDVKLTRAFPSKMLTLESFLTSNPIPSSCLYSREVYLAIGGHCPRKHVQYFEDWDFWIRLNVLIGGTGTRDHALGVGVGDAKFIYRRHEEGQSTQFRRQLESETEPLELEKEIDPSDASLKELKKMNPSAFGGVSSAEVRALMSIRSSFYARLVADHAFSGDSGLAISEYVKKLAMDGEYLACYRELTRQSLGFEVDAKLFGLAYDTIDYRQFLQWSDVMRNSRNSIHDTSTTVKQIRILYLVPWAVTGGADLYDLHLIRALRQKYAAIPGLHVTIMSEREISFVEQTLRDDFERVSDLILDLQSIAPYSKEISREDSMLEFVWEYVLARNITMVVSRTTIVGYSLFQRVKSLRKRRDLTDDFRYVVDNIKLVDILHLYTPGDMSGWEWRSGQVWQVMSMRLVISEDLKMYLMGVVGSGCNAKLHESPTIKQAHMACDEEFDGQNIKVINPPALFDEWKLSNVAISTNNIPRIIFVGRFEEQKDPMLWLDVVSHLASLENMRNVEMEMYGSGSLEYALRTYLSQSELFLHLHSKKRFRMHPLVPHSDLGGVLLSSARTVLLMTSKYEGMSMMLLEAISIGVPVVYLDCSDRTGGGIKEVNKNLGEEVKRNLLFLVKPSFPDGVSSSGMGECDFDRKETRNLLALEVMRVLENIISWEERYELAEEVRRKYGPLRFNEEVQRAFAELIK